MSGPCWTEGLIARALALQTFDRKHLVIVPNCTWPGSECDLLVVTPNLRVIDVEVKISRADLKADIRKDKWWHRYSHWSNHLGPPQPATMLSHPRRVWKHYYAMPKDIWKPEFKEILPPCSGVILVSRTQGGFIYAQCERRAKPNKDATKLTPESAIDVARLASLRYWDLIQNTDKWRRTDADDS